jgi:hypothetical protein
MCVCLLSSLIGITVGFTLNICLVLSVLKNGNRKFRYFFVRIEKD